MRVANSEQMTTPEKARRGSVASKGRGALVDRTTQRWVRATGRRVALEECFQMRIAGNFRRSMEAGSGP
jgi:hypothetical protein